MQSDIEQETHCLEVEGGVLSGTFAYSGTRPTIAAALIVAGSGPTDRDGNTQGMQGGSDCLRQLGEALAQRGIATLRFDKRLVGQSQSGLKEEDLRFETYIDDIRLWLDHLEEIVEVPIFLIGHSEGALLSAVVANDRTLAGFVSIAGVARPASELLLEQLRPRLSSDLLAQAEEILNALESGQRCALVPDALAPLFRPSVQPYLISWFRYDPAKIYACLQLPTLIAHGTRDIQVPVSEARRLAKVCSVTELAIVDGMNHVLKAVEGDAQADAYRNAALLVSRSLVAQIAHFVREAC